MKLSTVCSWHGQRGFQAVLDGQQFAGELLDGELVRLGNVFLGAATDVFAFGLGAQPGIVMFGGLQFELAELLLDAGQGVGVRFCGRRSDWFGDRFIAQHGFLGVFVV